MAGCVPKCSTEHRHRPFIAGRAPNCPEVPRDQWQKGNDFAKTPRENPANNWFNRQIYPTENTEEEDEEEKVNEDDVTTDELGKTAKEQSSKEDN